MPTADQRGSTVQVRPWAGRVRWMGAGTCDKCRQLTRQHTYHVKEAKDGSNEEEGEERRRLHGCLSWDRIITMR
jgi:hypothetical protein